MMLTAQTHHQPPFYMPSRPSPLSPLSERRVNAVPRFTFNMCAQSSEEKKPVPQRTYKPNPVMQTRDQATQRRRDMFFRRVQKDRDEKKWDARGDQIQRLDFVSEQKRWEAAKAREARRMGDEEIDEQLLEELISSQQQASVSQPGPQLDEADYIMQQEEQELEELLALMEEDEQVQHDTASQHYGSDDDDYESLFTEHQMSQESQQQAGDVNLASEDVDAMDMT